MCRSPIGHRVEAFALVSSERKVDLPCNDYPDFGRLHDPNGFILVADKKVLPANDREWIPRRGQIIREQACGCRLVTAQHCVDELSAKSSPGVA